MTSSPSPIALDFESFVFQRTWTPSSPYSPPPPPYQGQSYPQEKISTFIPSSSTYSSPPLSKPSSRRNLALLSFLAFLILAIFPLLSGGEWEWDSSALTRSQPTQPKFLLEISVDDPASSPPSSSTSSSPPNLELAAVPPPPSSFTSHSKSHSRRSLLRFAGSSSEAETNESTKKEEEASQDASGSTFPTSFGRWTKEEESALKIPETVWDVVDHGKFMLMGRPTHHVKVAAEEE